MRASPISQGIQSLLFHQAAIGFFFEAGFVELRVISPAIFSLHGHEVVSRQERFYFHDGLPHLVVSVLYRLATLPGSQTDDKRGTPRQAPPG